MIGFGLLCGHLVGDYWLQNGWMAANKANPVFQPKNGSKVFAGGGAFVVNDNSRPHIRELAREGHLACAIHCLFYTVAVWAFSFWWMPIWGLIACLVAHFVVDRFALARHWMMATEWHRDFATGSLSPWSIVVVDNTAHLVTLFLIAALAGQ